MMDEFQIKNMGTVIKSDKKDILLTSKDPHLSHLFEHGGPNTPNSVSAENLAQASIDVDGNYPEEANEHDYSLFQEQGTPFMPGFASEASPLIMDVNCADGCSGNSGRQNDENNNATTMEEKSKLVLGGNHRQISVGLKKGVLPPSIRPPNLLIGPTSMQAGHMNARDADKSHLLSPPADQCYNMQLLAHSAQQQQQLLQEEQRQQQEIYDRGSSSAALQQLAKFHQQKGLTANMIQDPSFLSKTNYPVYSQETEAGKVEMSGKPASAILANTVHQASAGQLRSTPTAGKQQPVVMPQYTAWSVTERAPAASDYDKGHVRDLSFGSQDSPLHPLQLGDVSKASFKAHPSSVNHKSANTVPVTAATRPEPELKSPLDHPDQFERRGNRFFSSDSGAASGNEQQAVDNEPPLNERDKKAAAAIGKLLDQNEKDPPVSHANSIGLKLNNVGMPGYSNLSVPLNVMQELIRNTPPPAYDQSYLQTGAALHPSIIAQNHQPIAMLMPNNDVKQEPGSPGKPAVQYYVPVSEQQKYVHTTNQAALVEQAKFLPGTNTELPHRSTELLSSASSASNIAENRVEVAFISQSAQSLNTDKPAPHIVNKPQPAKPRRSSSSGSTGRRKSDGNLTCNICGHSFRSTPALNGHMRVHSTSDKKNKDERQARSSSNDSATKSSPMPKTPVSPQTHQQAFFDPAKMQSQVQMQLDQAVNSDVRMLSYQYQPEGDPTVQNRSHNGLLTMASAACFLKTEASKADYPPTVLPPAYIVPHPVLFQQPAVVQPSYHVDVINQNYNENQSAIKQDVSQPNEPHAVSYSQIYPNPFQQALPISFFTNVAQPLLSQETTYSGSQPHMMAGVERGESLPNSGQAYIEPQKQMMLVAPEENYSSQYEPVPNTETNSLCQLASIAVAAAGRDYVPESDVQPGINYPANEMQQANTEGNATGNVRLIDPSTQQECLPQEEVFQPNMTTESSPLQSGNDPFFFPVTNPNQGQQRSQYGNNYNSAHNSGSVTREPMVTWKDNVDTRSYSMMSSYDDQLMQEAVNVANPSKILPNSMMGGTPPAGSILSGARPFRQRHHSEGAHLIKNSGTSILKQILDNPVPVERQATNERSMDCDKPETVNYTQPDTSLQITDVCSINGPQRPPDQDVKKEVWAEPKPIQRRVRHRRHSADSRLFLKPGSLPAGRQAQLVGNSNKKPIALRQERARRRPPPLVIPSSVNTFTSVQNLYQSHLHHRRRPSGDSTSSAVAFNDKIPPYTPPPMLSPIRAGSGLYCTTPVTPMFNRQKSFDTIPEVDESIEEDEELVRSVEPKINIGSRFQAVIPGIRHRKTVQYSKHKADLVWRSKSAEQNNGVYKHLEQFMELSCSAVVPFGGSNKEYALDCVAQSNGDILNAVRRLIVRKKDAAKHSKTLKNYTGSGKPWSAEEAKAFDCAMLEHRKDFFVISKMVKTRTTAECVERYYHVVKRSRRRTRLPRRYRDQENDDFSSLLAETLDERKIHSMSASSSEDEAVNKSKISSDSEYTPWMATEQNKSEISYSSHSSPSSINHHAMTKPVKTHAARIQHRQIDTPSPAGSPVSNMSNDDQPAQVFTCPVCGKSFGKVKSRNAHMKTHGKQAQEKRRQREEEAAKRREQNNRQMAVAHRPMPSLHPGNFIHTTAVNPNKLFPHPAMQQTRPEFVPRFNNNL